MRIGEHELARRVLIVAEIGNNHEGDLSRARQLVHEAVSAGVDAIKFQTFRAEHYVSRADGARFARLKSFELSFDSFAELAQLARRLGVLFLSTPFDLDSARFLDGIVDCFKIASGDNDFSPLIAQVVRTGKPLMISTGASDLSHVNQTVELVHEIGGPAVLGRLAILHCVSSYPVPPDEASLRAISALAAKFNCTIGYSDHTMGIDAAPLAVALGARIIEKHFTLRHDQSDFRDHQLSADPRQMKELVERVRVAERLLGNADKTVQPSEMASARAIRRSIVAARDLPSGHRLTEPDLTWIRPGGGLRPGQEGLLIGHRLRRAIGFGETIVEADLETP
jgi:sialic acid synthase SpsE